MIVIILGKKKLTDLERRQCAEGLNRIIKEIIRFNKSRKSAGDFIGVEYQIILK